MTRPLAAAALCAVLSAAPATAGDGRGPGTLFTWGGRGPNRGPAGRT